MSLPVSSKATPPPSTSRPGAVWCWWSCLLRLSPRCSTESSTLRNPVGLKGLLLPLQSTISRFKKKKKNEQAPYGHCPDAMFAGKTKRNVGVWDTLIHVIVCCLIFPFFRFIYINVQQNSNIYTGSERANIIIINVLAVLFFLCQMLLLISKSRCVSVAVVVVVVSTLETV